MGRKKVLVVTERFPPESVGGAEISLASVLTRLHGEKFSVFVATPSSPDDAPTKVPDAPTICPLPPFSAWPLPQAKKSTRSGLLRRSKLLWALILDHFTYFLRSRDLSFIERAKLILLASRLQRSKRGKFIPMRDLDQDVRGLASEALIKLCEEIQPDIIHADNCSAGILLGNCFVDIPKLIVVRDNRFLCPLRQQPTNVHGVPCKTCGFECMTHMPGTLTAEIKVFLEKDKHHRKELLRKYDRVVTTSKYLSEQILALNQGCEPLIVPNQHDIISSRIEALSEVRPIENPREILVVGMINENKGHDTIIEIIQSVAEEEPHFKIVLAGRGAAAKGIQRRATEAGLEHHLELTGFLNREEIYERYARASVVAMPNRWPEPFGRVPLESGLMRRPVVAFATGGVVETVIHKKTGLLVAPSRLTDFCASLILLLRDPRLATAYGEAAHHHITTHYSPDLVSAELANVWNAVLEGGG